MSIKRSCWASALSGLSELTEVTEFLAAVPEVDDGRMFAVQSPLMGALASYIWQNRDCFNRHCVTLLRARTTETGGSKGSHPHVSPHGQLENFMTYAMTLVRERKTQYTGSLHWPHH